MNEPHPIVHLRLHTIIATTTTTKNFMHKKCKCNECPFKILILLLMAMLLFNFLIIFLFPVDFLF